MDRTDLDRFSVPPMGVAVLLGGREFNITPQPKGRTMQFRKKLREALGDVSDLASVVQAAVAAVDDSVEVSVASLPLVQIMSVVIGFLDEGAERILNLIYEYEPTVAAEREWIEENAYDTEVCAALAEVVKLVYGPFLGVLAPAIKKATGGASEKEANEKAE